MIWRRQRHHWQDWRVRSRAAQGLGVALLVFGGGAEAQPPPLEAALPPEWLRSGGSLTTECEFADFVAAVAFVNRLVEPAEQLRHHPDVAIAYGRVSLRLTTHDAGGITALDLVLAQQISALHRGECQRPTPPAGASHPPPGLIPGGAD